MTLLTNSIEGVTPSGTTLTQGAGGNTGGSSGSFFDVVTIGTGATLASDGTHPANGSLGAKFATAGTASQVNLQWTMSLGTLTQTWFRIYLYLTANPAVSLRIVFLASSGTRCANLQISTAGKLTFLNTSGTALTTSTNTVPLNATFRVEGFVLGSATAGQTEVKLFDSPNSATPTETNTSVSSANTLGSMNQIIFGPNNTNANIGPFWGDDFGASSTGYLGPAVNNFTQTLTQSVTLNGVLIRQPQNALAVAASTSGALSRQVAQTLSSPVTTTAAIARQAARSYAATVSPSAALARQQQKALAVAAVTASTLVRQPARTLPATASATGALTRSLSRTAAAGVTATGKLARAPGRTLAAPVTTTVTLARQPGKSLPVSVTTVPALGRALSWTLAVTAQVTATLTRFLARAFTAAVTTAATGVFGKPRTLLISAGQPFLRWAHGAPFSRWSHGHPSVREDPGPPLTG